VDYSGNVHDKGWTTVTYARSKRKAVYGSRLSGDLTFRGVPGTVDLFVGGCSLDSDSVVLSYYYCKREIRIDAIACTDLKSLSMTRKSYKFR
jgi:hypothetical protein